MSAPIRVLIVDDSQDDALLMARAIRVGGLPVSFRRVDSADSMKAALRDQPCDVILSDYLIPDFSGIEALEIAREQDKEIPFIIVSGVIDEERAITAMKAGARDYIRKSDLGRLAPAIERELHEAAKRRELTTRSVAFSRLGQSLSSATSPQEAARIITGVADELIGWDSCFLYLYASTQDKFYHAFDVDVVDGKRTELPGVDWGLELTPMLKHVLACGPQLVLRDEARFNIEELRPFGDKSRPSASLLVVPVQNGAQMLGFLSIQSYATDAYNEEDLGTLKTLADYCGGALERIRLEKQLLEISSREQRRLGQNLHDGICQHLAGIGFLTEILADKLEEKSVEEVADARKISNLINDAVVQTRAIARGLFPVQLEENGLVSALQELAANTESVFKLSCEFRSMEPVLIRDSAIAEHLYYIAHEALMNAVKHAKANRISIALETVDEHHVLSVRDNGAGMTHASSRGMGLHIMKYRARMIGAQMQVNTEPGAGTTVTCLFRQTNGREPGPGNGRPA